MAESQALRDLLSELKRARSPLARMRIAAMAWRTLRSMSRDERRAIAKEIGIEEADAVLEKLGGRERGLTAADVLQAIGNSPEEDLDKARGALTRLAEPEARAEVVKKVIQVAAPPPPKPEPPKVEAPPPPPPKPPKHPEPSVWDAPRPEPRAPKPEAAPPPPVGPEGILPRFRALRAMRASGGDDDLDGRLETFPDGWQRRRALTWMIREGLVEEAALSRLTAKLSRASDRRFCERAFLHAKETA